MVLRLIDTFTVQQKKTIRDASSTDQDLQKPNIMHFQKIATSIPSHSPCHDHRLGHVQSAYNE